MSTTGGLTLGVTGAGVLLADTTLTLSAGGVAVTAPEGKWTVTTTKTGAYNANLGELVRCDPTAGAFTVTLPTAVGATGRRVSIKIIAASVNAVTVGTTGGQTIDGAATDVLVSGARTFATFVSDGANWLVT